MSMIRTAQGRAFPFALASLTTLATVAVFLGGAAPAHAAQAGTTDVECKSGNLTLNIADDGTVTGSATLTNCASPIDPGITSATVSISGHSSTLLNGATLVTSTDTTTWNTGESTTVNETRTIVGGNNVTEVGVGESLSGLFHPSTESESGHGTRNSTQARETEIIFVLEGVLEVGLHAVGRAAEPAGVGLQRTGSRGQRQG
ncbi:hypothetical protein ACFVXG_00055 [Kitasatospora sp. NPDC058162]|uniref:hypothetical protein n=1 Tax=Kitasatospora sp. NPDC058162 TaxID=3346362 RepID=UPI0036D7CA8D